MLVIRPRPRSHTTSNQMQPSKTRSRRGCLTCRSRRLKCDEKGPCCENCAADDRTCTWGLKASFHASRMHSLSKSESESFSALATRQRLPPILKFVDNTEEITSEYLTYGHGLDGFSGSEVADELAMSPSARLEVPFIATRSHPYAFDSEPTEHPMSHPRTLPNTDNSTPSLDRTRQTDVLSGGQDPVNRDTFSIMDQASYSTDQPLISHSPMTADTGPQSCQDDTMPPWPISQHSKARLIAAYLKETATWCETTDTARHFSLESAHTILSSQALSAAATALASRQLDNMDSMGGKARVETLELYDFARETLMSLESWQNDETVLASVVQLCVYCMMSMEVNEWRLHLRGCAGTFQEMGWNGSSGGLPSACFWAFARIDIWAAYLTQQPTLLPMDIWIDCDYLDTDSSPLQDKYANKVIWLFARIINQIFNTKENRRDAPLSNSEQSTRGFEDIWEELNSWYKNRPACVQSVIEVEPAKNEAFPIILFGNQSAICGNIFYHTACLQLLEAGIQKDNQAYCHEKYEPQWHARRIGGISTTTDNHANWVNNLQPIFIAAHYYNDPAEKIAILKHLKVIEVSTGWKTSSRSAELRNLWGLA